MTRIGRQSRQFSPKTCKDRLLRFGSLRSLSLRFAKAEPPEERTPQENSRLSHCYSFSPCSLINYREGAKPETIAEIEELAASLRALRRPGVVEEMLVQKIVIETARYGRILALEQPEPGRPRLYSLMCLDRTIAAS